MGKLVSENNPELWDAVTTIAGDKLVSANELALVHWARHSLNGHDVNLAELPEFIQAATPVVAGIVERQNELIKAALQRADA